MLPDGKANSAIAALRTDIITAVRPGWGAPAKRLLDQIVMLAVSEGYQFAIELLSRAGQPVTEYAGPPFGPDPTFSGCLCGHFEFRLMDAAPPNYPRPFILCAWCGRQIGVLVQPSPA